MPDTQAKPPRRPRKPAPVPIPVQLAIAAAWRSAPPGTFPRDILATLAESGVITTLHAVRHHRPPETIPASVRDIPRDKPRTTAAGLVDWSGERAYRDRPTARSPLLPIDRQRIAELWTADPGRSAASVVRAMREAYGTGLSDTTAARHRPASARLGPPPGRASRPWSAHKGSAHLAELWAEDPFARSVDIRARLSERFGMTAGEGVALRCRPKSLPPFPRGHRAMAGRPPSPDAARIAELWAEFPDATKAKIRAEMLARFNVEVGDGLVRKYKPAWIAASVGGRPPRGDGKVAPGGMRGTETGPGSGPGMDAPKAVAEEGPKAGSGDTAKDAAKDTAKGSHTSWVAGIQASFPRPDRRAKPAPADPDTGTIAERAAWIKAANLKAMLGDGHRAARDGSGASDVTDEDVRRFAGVGRVKGSGRYD